MIENPRLGDLWGRIFTGTRGIGSFVNGKLVVFYTEPEGVVPGRRLNLEEGGSFAIQAHDPKSEVHYRNIRVKELP